MTGRNGRGSWERQGITAFCTCQWIDWLYRETIWHFVSEKVLVNYVCCITGITIFYLVLYDTVNANILLRKLNIPEAAAFVYAFICLRIYRDILHSAAYVLLIPVSVFTLYGLSYNGAVSVLFSSKVIWVTAEIPSGNATGHYDENKMGERVRTIHYLRKKEVEYICNRWKHIAGLTGVRYLWLMINEQYRNVIICFLRAQKLCFNIY